ncbi:MAG: hypothetical protein JO019_00985 [Candidatus Kaiserbacteria bacterium]|nr:hypothetical protein [Candidatus Kaiserbacteria bacterium]
MKISWNERKISDHGDFIANFYVKKEDGKPFNALIVDVLKGHYKARLKGAARVYLVLDGKGTFTINETVLGVEQNDLIVIQDGDAYSYEGKMRLFEFNVPATDRDNEEKLE